MNGRKTKFFKKAAGKKIQNKPKTIMYFLRTGIPLGFSIVKIVFKSINI